MSDTTGQAIDWAIRVGEPDFADWDGFTSWLEADPAHGDAYEAALAASEAAEPAFPVMAAAPIMASSETRRRPRRWAWGAGGSAIAASVAALLAWSSWAPVADPYLIRTAPGVRQEIAIAGARIVVNGDSRIWLDHNNPRIATVERGEAMFDVAHDTQHPFVVKAGDAVLQDVGTRFDVTRDKGLRVAVAEGAVLFNPGREAVRIEAGRELIVEQNAGAAELHPRAPQTIGGWREGRFAYAAAPIAAIAADLTRSTGIPIVATAGVATRPFTGVITFTGDQQALLADLGPLLGVQVVKGDRGWSLRARTVG